MFVFIGHDVSSSVCLAVTFVAGDNVRPAQVLLSSAVHCSSPVATAPPTSHLRASGETCDTIADSEPVPSSPNVRKAAQVLQHLSRLTPDLPTTFGAGGSTRLLSVSSASGSPMSGLTGPGFVPSKAMVDNLGLQMILLDVGVTGDGKFLVPAVFFSCYAHDMNVFPSRVR